MVSLARTIRSIRRVGIKEWWHQMQYIGDAKSGTFKGKDQCVAWLLLSGNAILTVCLLLNRFGNRYFENLNPEEEIPGACILYGKHV